VQVSNHLLTSFVPASGVFTQQLARGRLGNPLSAVDTSFEYNLCPTSFDFRTTQVFGTVSFMCRFRLYNQDSGAALGRVRFSNLLMYLWLSEHSRCFCSVRRIQESEGGMYQYFIKVVPTIYTDLSGHVISTNQVRFTSTSVGKATFYCQIAMPRILQYPTWQLLCSTTLTWLNDFGLKRYFDQVLYQIFGKQNQVPMGPLW
jgi:hypothetical protein